MEKYVCGVCGYVYDPAKGDNDGGSNEKKTPTELKQKARDQYAPFVNESVNVLLDMVMLGSVQSAPRAALGGLAGR